MSDAHEKLQLAVAVNAAIQRQYMFGELFSTRDRRDVGAWDAYGYADALEFEDYYTMYSRFGIANAAVRMIVDKCWQSHPFVLNAEGQHEPTAWERRFTALADRLSLFDRLKGLDWRQRIGRYAGLIMFVDDGKQLVEPLQRMPSERSLVDVRPVVEGQLLPTQYDDDPASIRYGQPVIFQFNEQALGDKNPSAGRSVQIHYSRVIIWAEGADDGTVYGAPCLEPIFNSLLTLERIIGSGGVGFWKAARQSPVLNIQKDANLQQLATALGVSMEELPNAMDEQIQRWQKGFDQALMTQGIEATALNFNVPQPKDFFDAALNDVAAGAQMPATILIGQQTGRLASDEDQSQWAQSAESRRSGFLNCAIKQVVNRFVELGFLPAPGKLLVEWDSLQEPSPSDKLSLVEKMANVNKALMGTGVEAPFTADEMRDVAGYEPMKLEDVPEGDPEDDPADE